MEQPVSFNEVNSTIFLFTRFHQISVDADKCQNTQNIIAFMVRWEFFSQLTMKVFSDLEHGSGPELHPQIRRERCFTLFYVGSEILGFDFSRKNGVQYSILLISAKVLDQIKREWLQFVSTEPFLLAVFGWFPKSA